MARIIVGSWAVRYPLGGNLSWTLQWLLGFHRLGHEVYLAEKAGYPDSCFDPIKQVMSDDCKYGFQTVTELLNRFGLHDRLCYVDAAQVYHGLSKTRIQSLFRSADLFVDIGSHGTWMEEAQHTGLRILVDGEPGATQMKMVMAQRNGAILREYDYYYSNGANLGTSRSSAPTANREWRPLFNPVETEIFADFPPAPKAPFTTVMNWQAHAPLEFEGKRYGQKDMMFPLFLDLPKRTKQPLEIAVAGKVPLADLEAAGWSVRKSHAVTVSFDSYLEYIKDSAGEFSVAKQVYVETRSGWFSDRSAAYLAAGRPVVLQDTGFSEHLPCGRGLFAVDTMDDAADAIEQIRTNYETHSKAAREIAKEFLATRRILGQLLRSLNIH
jgi:hypothetical protein